jgi:hypothetical protein
VRNVQELAIALGLWEGHEPWHAKVPEDLRFVVKGLNKLPYFCGSGDACHLNAIRLIHMCHHLCPYPRGEGHKDGVDVINCFAAVDFGNEAIKGEKEYLP